MAGNGSPTSRFRRDPVMSTLRLLAATAGALASQVLAANANPQGIFNQAGIEAGSPFSVVLPAQADGQALVGTWQIVSPEGKVQATGTLPAARTWDPAGENSQRVLVPGLPEGVWTLRRGNDVLAEGIKTSKGSLDRLFKGAAKAFYYNRASMELASTHAGRWARAAGHPDTWADFHPSSGKSSGGISSSKGWYDAGDYNKYIVNSAFAVWMLLDLAQRYPAYIDSAQWNLPESGNKVPDLLDEVRWNLEWMLTMQDPNGGVYFKLTSKEFSGSVMPAADLSKRFVVGIGTASSLDFAATMAVASRVYKPYDAAFAARCLTAAEAAFAWAKANPSVAFKNPTDVKTGEYGDNSFSDEFFFAAVELSLARRDRAIFAPYAASLATQKSLPWWGNPGVFGLYTIVANPDFFTTEVEPAKRGILSIANTLKSRAENSGYGLAMIETDFAWGSNSSVAVQGYHMLQAWNLTGDSLLLRGARTHLEYLVGLNPLARSYVTGFGSRPPMDPHHRPSEADGVVDPVPGFVVGGPTDVGADIGTETWQCEDYRSAKGVAYSWIDDRCSYATNEIAINWNAALAGLSGQLSAIHLGLRPTGPVTGVERRGPGHQALSGARLEGLGLVVPQGPAVRVSLHDASGRETWAREVEASGAARRIQLPGESGLRLVVLTSGSERSSFVRITP